MAMECFFIQHIHNHWRLQSPPLQPAIPQCTVLTKCISPNKYCYCFPDCQGGINTLIKPGVNGCSYDAGLTTRWGRGPNIWSLTKISAFSDSEALWPQDRQQRLRGRVELRLLGWCWCPRLIVLRFMCNIASFATFLSLRWRLACVGSLSCVNYKRILACKFYRLFCEAVVLVFMSVWSGPTSSTCSFFTKGFTRKWNLETKSYEILCLEQHICSPTNSSEQA